jgi:hypothetical protein
MDFKVSVKWLEALRSGRYRQTRGRLQQPSPSGPTESGFCCLGVLCDLHREFINGQVKSNTAVWDNDGTYLCGGFQSSSVLPENVREWAGLDSLNPGFPRLRSGGEEHRGYVYLSDLNDKGESFDAIADVIEANVDVL